MPDRSNNDSSLGMGIFTELQTCLTLCRGCDSAAFQIIVSVRGVCFQLVSWRWKQDIGEQWKTCCSYQDLAVFSGKMDCCKPSIPELRNLILPVFSLCLWTNRYSEFLILPFLKGYSAVCFCDLYYFISLEVLATYFSSFSQSLLSSKLRFQGMSFIHFGFYFSCQKFCLCILEFLVICSY